MLVERQRITLNELSAKVIGIAMEVHKALGPGLLESAYEEVLAYELREAGHTVQKQLGLPLVHKEVRLDCGYRIDLLVDDQIIIEVKSVEALNDVHLAQVLTYLKLSQRNLGLLMNFNVARLKDGLKRVVNEF